MNKYNINKHAKENGGNHKASNLQEGLKATKKAESRKKSLPQKRTHQLVSHKNTDTNNII